MNRLAAVALTLVLATAHSGSTMQAQAAGSSGKINARSARVGGKNHARGDKTKSKAYLAATKVFAAGHYGEALQQFRNLDKNGMCCDLVHYYMALCYQRQNQLICARKNYQYVIEYSKDPRLIAYAQSASAQLEYYGAHRTYEGNGNDFVGSAPGSDGGGGGGGGGC